MSWPREIKKQVVLGNFRVRSAKPKHKNSAWRDKRPGMSEDHLALIRQLPCCVTRGLGGEAHHLKSGTGERGMAVRSTDRWAVPMGHDAHMEVERAGTRNEASWFAERGIDPHELARDLWAATGDLERMRKVLAAHWKHNASVAKR